MPNGITKEEWVDWKQNYVTQSFIQALRATREGKKEEIAEGKVEGNQLYLEIGRVQGILDCLEYALKNFEYLQIEDDNAKSSGLSSDSES